jgi:predicted nucleic acid-binding protein
MSLVLDTSVSLMWCLPGQATLASLAILDRVRLQGAHVPFIWHVEMANILGLKVRDGNLEQHDLDESVRLLNLLKITTEDARGISYQDLFSAMARFQLTSYDSSYLDLASRTGFELATFDKAMIAAARRTGIPLTGPEA